MPLLLAICQFEASLRHVKDQWAGWARVYAAVEWCALGTQLTRARERSLEPLESCERVLLLGDGDGRFLSQLCRRGFSGEIVSVDLSDAMIARARRRLEKNSPEAMPRVTWIRCDVTVDALPDGPFDGIGAQFFFDNFSAETTGEVIRRVDTRAASEAVWAIADFVSPELLRGWRRTRQRLLLGVLYAAFRHTTGIEARRLPPFASLLEAEGWMCRRSWRSSGSVVAASTWKRAAPRFEHLR